MSVKSRLTEIQSMYMDRIKSQQMLALEEVRSEVGGLIVTAIDGNNTLVLKRNGLKFAVQWSENASMFSVDAPNTENVFFRTSIQVVDHIKDRTGGGK